MLIVLTMLKVSVKLTRNNNMKLSKLCCKYVDKELPLK